MKEKIKKYLKEIVYFILTMTLFANAISYYKSIDLNTQPLDIKSLILLNDEAYSLPQEKPILVHFWASWCPVCKLEASNIQKISEHFEVITVAVQSGSDEQIKEYLVKNGYTFKVVNDGDSLLAQQFHIGVYPSTFIYDKNKNLVFSEVGYTSTVGLYLRMLWAKW